MRTLGRLLAHGPRYWRPQTSSREIFILLAYLRGIQYTSFSYYFGVPIYRAVKEVMLMLSLATTHLMQVALISLC